ncbi:hypothetical protein C0J52_20348 [Blattella germanica]|nr:hypothetical protein C0J52_20348 [Blattella germanica]
MYFRYIILTTLTIFIGIFLHFYLQGYNVSRFIEIAALYPYSLIYPNLNSLSIYLHNSLSNWYGNAEKQIKSKSKVTLFTKEELQRFSEPKIGLYLAILGKVYDVSTGEKHYGPGGPYHFFTGRDASRAFITGEFTEKGLSDDILGLTSQELLSLDEWAQFYRKDYKYKGKLIGRYYNSNGEPTQYYREIRKLINEAKHSKEETNNEKLLYPPCNAEWTQDSGSRVWCTTMSGGIQRDWVGVPRQFYEPGSKSYRCACIQESELDGSKKGNLKEYPDCNPKATSCRVYT